ncbi:MAG: hypothetical protein R2698_14570 [Microthrixaceae bacterium]
MGFDYRIDREGDDGGPDTPTAQADYQDTCPRCRRAAVTLAQTARVGGFG